MKNSKTGIFKYFRGDKGIWYILLLLSIISVLAVYSSTGRLSYSSASGYSASYILKHIIILASSWLIVYWVHKIPYTFFAKVALFMILPTIALLLFTLFMEEVNGAHRWIGVGRFTFQPSELGKVILILFTARQLTKYQSVIKEKKTFLRLLWAPALVIGLIFPENLSTALLLSVSCFMLFVVGGVSSRYLWRLTAAGAAAAILLLAVFKFVPAENLPGRFGTWKNRIENFSGEESQESYQVTQAKIAVAGGQLFGKGPGNSTQRNFLPHPYSDYIYALIIEEYGMFVGIGVMMLYLWMLFRAIRIARKCPGSFGSYIVLGLTFMLTLQAMVNMGVAVNLLPVTGQPLPFLSMGGTSLWITAFAFGVILSVSVSVQEKEEREAGTENLEKRRLPTESGERENCPA